MKTYAWRDASIQSGAQPGICYGGQKRGSGDGRPPAESGGGLGAKPQKLKTHAEYSTEQSHRSSQIAYCSESDYTLKTFSATTGDMHPCPPGYATTYSHNQSSLRCSPVSSKKSCQL